MAISIIQRLDEHSLHMSSQDTRITLLEQVVQGLCGIIGADPAQFLPPQPAPPSYNNKVAADAYAGAGSAMAEAPGPGRNRF